MSVAAVLVAAGSGSRLGTERPKAFVDLAGQPLLVHAVQRLPVELVVAVVPAALVEQARALLRVAGPQVLVVAGGASRHASVVAGLAALPPSVQVVLVHDAARCLLHPEAVERLISACSGDAVGGLLALPLADTLKQADSDGRVAATLDRGDKWTAQTPQMFRLGLLRQALARAGDTATDEASAIEAIGHAPLLVHGEPDNFKLTWPADFALAERLLRNPT